LYLILSDADRERLGAPERLELDLGSITNREAIQVRTMGFRTPRMFRLALQATPLDAEGNRAGDDDKLAADGGTVVDYDLDYEAWTVALWLALKRAGIATDVRELEFDLDAMGISNDEEPEVAPKADPEEVEPDPSTP
jgi:hypothetical protein